MIRLSHSRRLDRSAPTPFPRRPQRIAPPLRVLLAWAGVGIVSACGGDAGEPLPWTAEEAELLHTVLLAEDARPQSQSGLAPLLQGLEAEDPALRARAAVGLARLERDSLATHLEPLLADSSPEVRKAAAWGLGHSVRGAGAEATVHLLLARGAVETDEGVRGELALALGRLPPGTRDDLRRRAESMVDFSTGVESHRGLFLLARRPEASGALPQRVVDALVGQLGGEGEGHPDARVRRLAMAALVAAGQAGEEQLVRGLADPDPWVRREAALGSTGRSHLVMLALEDPHPVVRVEGVRRWDPTSSPAGCAPLLAAAGDPGAHVQLEALQALERCASPPATGGGGSGAGAAQAVDLLAGLVEGSTEDSLREGGGWHAPTRALHSLAVLDPAEARRRLSDFLATDNGFVRAWAARTAARLGELPTLRTLATDDPDPNVRTAALQGLLAAGAGEAAAMAALEADDAHLLLTAARGLEGTRDARAVEASLQALERLSRLERETLRDPRVALLRRVQEAAGWATSAAVSRESATGESVARESVVRTLEPLLTDLDPVVARLSAEVLEAWTGTTHSPRPRSPMGIPVPTPMELHALAAVAWAVEMESGAVFHLQLLPWDAPTNAARFARLARSGHFQGLTFHRVVPNFVIQGGSPGANEYMGHGPYTRDEILHPHWRGTVGLSTRGRDTGDGQIFVNLVDNIRLDPDYTVFGVLITEEDMEAAERVLEGDRIHRVREVGNLSP